MVKLTAVKGKFVYCVSANNSRIEDQKDCTWNDFSFDGLISFGSSDKDFSPRGSYGILVKPQYNSAFKKQTFSYSLRVITPTEYTSFLLGQQETYFNVPTNELFFRTSISKNSKYFSFLMTTDDPNCKVLLSNDINDFLIGSPSEFFRSLKGKRLSTYYSSKDLENLCQPYQKAYGSKPNMVKPGHLV